MSGVDYVRATKVARIRLGWPKGLILARALHDAHTFLLFFGVEVLPRWSCLIALEYSKRLMDEISYIAKNWEMFAPAYTSETPATES